MKKNNNEIKKVDFIGNMKASFSGRKFRSGAYATAISTVVIIMILVVNLIVSKMDIQVDLSSTNLYTLSEDTKTYLSGLTDDISLYYMIQQGNETELYEKIAKQYDKLSDHITLEKKDPILYPEFASQFVTDEVAENSFIVVNNTTGRAKYIDGNDMVIQEMNYQTYQNETTGIDVEGQLTSALQYVTSEDLPVMYVTQGHGETDTGTAFTESIGKLNVSSQTLSTLTTDAIPEDCDILYINAPKKDFSDAETTMIMNYLAAGGKVIMNVDYSAVDLTNLTSILDYYGIKIIGGVVLEADTNQFISGYPNYVIPTIESHEITTQAKSGGIPIFMPTSTGLAISDTTRSSLAVEPLLSTSTSAYAKVNVESTSAAKEDGDIAGPFYLGLVATDTFNNVTSNLVVYSSEYTFSDETSTFGNADLLSGTIGYMSGDMETLSIPSKSLAGSYIQASQFQSVVWAAVTTLGIPVIIFIIGAVICFRRRRK